MKKINIQKLLILLPLVILINSCGFNPKDENAWKKKLCEGTWENNNYIYNRENLIVKYKFKNDETYECDENWGDWVDHKTGTWKIASSDWSWKFDSNIDYDKRTITTNYTHILNGVNIGNFNVDLIMIFRKDKKFELHEQNDQGNGEFLQK